MSRTQVALLVGCLVCLLAVSAALPAADPRLEVPGGGGETGATIDGGSEAATGLNESNDRNTTLNETATDTANDSAEQAEPALSLSGVAAPGGELTVSIENDSEDVRRTVLFGAGANRSADELLVHGQERFEGNAFEVPLANAVTVRVPELNLSRTVSVDTSVDLDVDLLAGVAAPTTEIKITATTGEMSLGDAAVILDGDTVGSTDRNGTTIVTLPETAGPAELRVEHEVTGTAETIDVAEIDLSVDSWLLFPGVPTGIEVTADGVPVEGATVATDVDSGSTDEQGVTSVRVPISDSATFTAELGAETASTSIGNLYLRLGAVIVIVPGLVIGGIWSYFKAMARLERSERFGSRGSVTFVTLGDFLARVGELSLPRPHFGAFSWPSLGQLEFPSLRVPRPTFPSIPLLRPSLLGWGSSEGGLSVGFPSLGTDDSKSRLSSLFDRSSSDSSEEDSATAAADADSEAVAEDAGIDPKESPRGAIYAAWHTFVDGLDISNRKRRTAGEIARQAFRAGLPSQQVRQLVRRFRAVEYGDKQPTPEDAQEAYETATTLAEKVEDDQ